jgi:class 3 adenylate cyclase
VPECSQCQTQNPPEARFCLSCGSPLPTQGAPTREVRKTVTVVFSDVASSTSLGDERDPESVRRVMGRYFEQARAVLERHGGTVEKFIGDAVMAVFGIPTLHEDDALRAVQAAAELRERLVDLNEELERNWGIRVETRTGVNTGRVVTGSAETLATGDAVNVAARLEQTAAPGEVLLGETTYTLVRDAVSVEPVEPIELKGKRERTRAYRLLEVRAGAAGRERRMGSPMVGRDRQLALLLRAFDNATSDRACHLFTILGSAGVGKSRLAEEFLGSLPAQTRVLRGRCLPYGEGISFWPLRKPCVRQRQSPRTTTRRGLCASSRPCLRVRKAPTRWPSAWRRSSDSSRRYLEVKRKRFGQCASFSSGSRTTNLSWLSSMTSTGRSRRFST